MAGASLLTLLDDIASLLDDISAMTKVTAGKTAGLLGDDLALNAHQLTGVRAERELPVVWAVAKGSLINKCILLPLAFLISAFLPWLVQPLLMLGGAYLCYEGAEKVLHGLRHKLQGASAEDHNVRQQHLQSLHESPQKLLEFERNKIRGAVRTDFILSAEIIVIALGSVQDMAIAGAIAVVSLIALIMTVGVYSLVAAIVKLDDVGLMLIQSARMAWLGRGLLGFCPWLMKSLSVVGTLAMFLVGGAILVHGVPGYAHWLEHLLENTLVESLVRPGLILSQAMSGLLIGVGVVVVGALLAKLNLGRLLRRARG